MTDAPSFAVLAEQVRTQIGYRLFTVLGWVPERRALRRLWSSNPAAFTVGGEKTTAVDPAWLSGRVELQHPFLGSDAAAMRAVFHDHALIESLGCGAVLNTTVVDDRKTLAVLSVLDATGAYDTADLARLVALTPRFLPATRHAMIANRSGDNW